MFMMVVLYISDIWDAESGQCVVLIVSVWCVETFPSVITHYWPSVPPSSPRYQYPSLLASVDLHSHTSRHTVKVKQSFLFVARQVWLHGNDGPRDNQSQTIVDIITLHIITNIPQPITYSTTEQYWIFPSYMTNWPSPGRQGKMDISAIQSKRCSKLSADKNNLNFGLIYNLKWGDLSSVCF